MTPDAPDEQNAAEPTPDEVPGAVPADSHFVDLSELPEPAPQVSLIGDEDLSWVDEPQESDEEIEARRLRHEAYKKKVRRKRKGRRALKFVGFAMATLLVLGLIWFQWTFSGLQRMPAVAGQAGLNTPGTTMLLIGSNPEEPDADSVSGTGWKHDMLTSDLVMLLHLSRDNRSMFVISIPGDSVLPIPGGSEGKLSDAYLQGGAPLYVRTIEQYTGVALDRVAVMDLNALRVITDQVGGVVVDVPRAACGLLPGQRRLDGRAALQYVAKADCLPRKDLDRVERQQSMLRGLMRSAIDGGKIANPFRVQKMLKATASNLTLEKGFSYPSMFSTLFSMRHLRTTNTTFLTVPTAAQPNIGFRGTDAIRLDPTKDAALWEALKKDRLADYLATNDDAVVLR